MEKLWTGRFHSPLDALADDFNSSLRFDRRMYKEDIEGSLAHAGMLFSCGIIGKDEYESIRRGLCSIREDLETGKLTFGDEAEDIHSFIEGELTARIGEAGKKLHTARSRNDQVALDLRLYLKKECAEVKKLLYALIAVIAGKADETKEMIMPGYTHLQRAQPITMGHHLLAYAQMLLRDAGRLDDAVKRMNISPLGSAALAGTSFPIDRAMTAKALGFDAPCSNSVDGVSDRDYALELLSCFSILMMHLSRFSEEIILWCSFEFGFLELDDAYTTGSSIMPQKKNPDMAELVRGKTGRVYGDLMGLLATMKGLPLAYNKDLQEDKEAVFDALDTVKACLSVFAPMLRGGVFHKEKMYAAAEKGYINATDLADYLTGKGMPFRTAYKLVGETVAECAAKGIALSALPLEAYKEKSPLFDGDLYEAIKLETCVKKRLSEGGTSPESVRAQIAALKKATAAAAAE
ncbi:MAG: argininosuccinate lyase [Clostridia bacterium]|nr:argininosuccinate lyase [Clostridia bacterium]